MTDFKRLNLKEVLINKAEYPVRLIALKDEPINDVLRNINYFVGDEIGIEAIDFSTGSLRVVNKTRNFVFELYYNKDNWDLGFFKIKERD